MKRLLFALLLAGAAATTQAQDQQGQRQRMDPKQRAERMTSMMEKQYALTAEQTKQVSDVNTKMAEETQKMMESGTRDREQMKAINDKRSAEYKKILTPEQYAKYEKDQADRQSRMRDGNSGGGRRGGGQQDGGGMGNGEMNNNNGN